MTVLDKIKLLWGRHSALLITLAVTLAAFSPVFFAEFSNWDDDVYLTDNPLIKQLSWPVVVQLFTSFHSGLYKPLVLLSFAIEYHFAVLDPTIYHVTNLVIHLLNTLLVFLIAERLTSRLPVVFGVALLFGIHPMHVESVAWISERKDVLYSLFFLLAMQQYLRYRGTGSKWSYWVAVLSTIVSFTAKPMGITFPLALLLLDYLQARKMDRSWVLDKLPFVAAAGAFGLLAYFSVSSSHALVQRYDFTFWDNICVGFYGLLIYLWRFFAPVNLSCLYPYPHKINDQLPFIYVWAPVLAVLLLAMLFYLFRKDRRALFGMLFFLLTVSLGLQWIPLAPSVSFDHYSYISYIGLSYILCEYLYDLYHSAWFQSAERRRELFVGACAAAAVALVVLTFMRSMVWENPETLWSDVLKKYEHSTAYSNRGAYYMKKRDSVRALSDFNNAIRINPYMAEAYVNRGAVYSDMGDNERAIAENRKALRLRPYMFQPDVNIAIIYGKMGKNDEALASLRNALDKNALSPELYSNKATIFMQQGKYQLALVEMNKAISLNPGASHLYGNMGNLFFMAGNYAESARLFDKALSMGTELNMELYHNRGVSCMMLGDVGCAIDSFSRALMSDPVNVDLMLKRGAAYSRAGMQTEAIADFTYVLRVSTKVVDAYVGRGFVYLNRQQGATAEKDFLKAAELLPKSADINSGLGAALFMEKKYAEAEAAFGKAIASDPKNPQHYFNRARVYDAMGKYPKALADAKKAVALNPKYERALYLQAIISRKTGAYKAGLDYINKALAINPKSAQSYEERGLLLLKASSCEAALPDLRKALSLDKNLKETAAQLALCKS